MNKLESEYKNLKDCLRLWKRISSRQANIDNVERALKFVQHLHYLETDGDMKEVLSKRWRNERIEEMNRLPVGND